MKFSNRNVHTNRQLLKKKINKKFFYFNVKDLIFYSISVKCKFLADIK